MMPDDLAARLRNEVRIAKSLTATHRLVTFTVGKRHPADMTLAVYIRSLLPRYEDEFIRRWCRQEFIRVDGVIAHAEQTMTTGQQVVMNVPLPPPDPDYVPPPLHILWHDEHLAVLVKQPGHLAHQAGKIMTGTLINQLQDWMLEQGGEPSAIRLVNRIDRDTSGLVLASLDLPAHVGVSRAIEKRQVFKGYRAICHGIPDPRSGHWREPIGGSERSAVVQEVRTDGLASHTEYTIQEDTFGVQRSAFGVSLAHVDAVESPSSISQAQASSDGASDVFEPIPNAERRTPNDFSLLRIILHTGRQHQIRVHAAHHGCPLVGDWMYGTPCAELGGQALHAAELAFTHPLTGEALRFAAPLPKSFHLLWEDLKNGGNITPIPLNAGQRSRLGLPP